MVDDLAGALGDVISDEARALEAERLTAARTAERNGEGAGPVEPAPVEPDSVAESAAPWTTVEALDQARAWIARFIFASAAQITVDAVWLLHSWALRDAYVTPYLHVTSPAPDCGKSTLAEVMHAVSRDGELMVDPTGPLFYRLIDETQATVFIDEVDTTLAREERRSVIGFLNAGYRKGGTVPRLDPPHFKTITRYKVFSPKMIVGLDDGFLPATLASRCIRQEMRPATHAELDALEPFILHDLADEAEALRAGLAAWAEAVELATKPAEDIKDFTPRKREMLRPLLVIAEQIGGEGEREIRRAIREVIGGARSRAAAETKTVQLLKDIRTIFEEADSPESMPSVTLLSHLVSIPDGPYAEHWGFEDRLTGNVVVRRSQTMALARRLGPFGIRPSNVWDATTRSQFKGYKLADFADAWARYLPDPEEAEEAQAPDTGVQGRIGRPNGVVEPETDPSEVVHKGASVRPRGAEDRLEQRDWTTYTTADAVLEGTGSADGSGFDPDALLREYGDGRPE